MATQKPDLTRIWANGAPPGNVVDPDTTTPGKVLSGWQAEVPPFEHFNFLQKWFTQGLAHFNEQGIGVWDTDTTYPVDGIVKGSNGLLYTAILEQSGNDPISDNGTNWEPSLGNSFSNKNFTLVSTTLSILISEIESKLPKGKIEENSLFKSIEYTSGEYGGNEYILLKAIDDASRPSEDLGSIIHISTSGSEGYYLKGLFQNGNVDLRQFGIFQSITDNSQQIERCLTYSDGRTILGGDGETYKYLSNITITGKNFNIDGDFTLEGVDSYITVQGSLTDYGELISADAKGERQIAVTDTSGITKGDVIIIHNQNPFSFSQHRSEYFDGEFNIVEEVQASILKLTQSLRSYYGTLTNIKLFKLNGINVNIKNTKFAVTGTPFYGLRVKFCKSSVIESADFIAKNSTSCVTSLSVEKSYNTSIIGGYYFNDTPAGGTQYGINIVNSQLVNIVGVTSYAERHAITTGGDAEDGAVPCRYININDSYLSNAGSVYSADFHGNTSDSGYYNCDIDNDIGLAGENIDCVGNTILARRNNPPIELQEIVGGVINIKNNTVRLTQGFVFNTLCAFSASSLSQKVDREFELNFQDNSLELNSGVTQLVTLLYNQDNAVKSTLDIRNINVSGDTSSLERIAQLARSGSGLNPDQVSIVGIKYHLPAFIEFVALSGSFAGTTMTLPSQRMIDTDLTIEASGHESTKGGSGDTGIYIWDYTNYPKEPHVSVDHSGWARAGDPQFFAAIDSLTTDNTQLFLTTASSSITTPVERTLSISAISIFENVVL